MIKKSSLSFRYQVEEEYTDGFTNPMRSILHEDVPSVHLLLAVKRPGHPELFLRFSVFLKYCRMILWDTFATVADVETVVVLT